MKYIVSLFLVLCLTQSTAFAKHKTYKTHKHQHPHGKGLKHKVRKTEVRQKDFFNDTPRVQLPDSVDLRGQVSPIWDQGLAGTCWAWSLTDALYNTWKLSGVDPGMLSVAYLVHAAQEIGEGCDGGYFDAADYWTMPKGGPLAAVYPYSQKDCAHTPPKVTTISVQGAKFIPIVPSHYNQMYVLAKLHRPLSITTAAGAGDWESYHGGLYNGCEIGETDHMIQRVGLNRKGANFGKDGNLPAQKGIGIDKNQWGLGFGDAGYIEIQLTDAEGNPCNMEAAEAGYWEIEGAPVPGSVPVPPPHKKPWWCKYVPASFCP